MEWVKSLNPQQKALADKVIRAAEKYGVDPAFALSTAKAENDDFMHSVKRKSNKGAIGLMQIMPNTAKGLKIDPYNVDQNIDGGVRYLKENLDRFGGDKMLASVAYNYGPNSNFFKNGYLPDETRGYITRITKHGGYGDVPVGTMPTPPMQKISTGTQAMAEKKPSYEIKIAPVDEGDLAPWNPSTTTTGEKFASRQVGVDDAIAAGGGALGGAIVGHMLRPPTEREEKNIRGDVRNELTANQQRIALAQAQAQADAIASGQPVQTQTTAPTQDRGYGTKNWVYQEYSDPVGRLVESMGPDTKPHADELAKSVSGIRQYVKNMPQGPLPMQASPYSPLPNTPPPAPPVAQTSNLGVAPTRANLANLAPPQQLTPAQLQRQVLLNRAKNVGSGKSGGALMGAIAGQQGYDAQQKFNQGDVFGGLTSAITGTGAALTMSPNPKFKALGAASTAAGGGLHLLQNIFNTEDQTKATLQPDGTPVKYKKGGAVKKPVGGLSAVEHFDGGGRTGLAKTVAGKIAGAFGQGPGQLIVPTAEEIAKFSAKPTRQLKFSEAIRPYQDQYLGVHMSDRQGVHGNRWGGTGFPNFQNINPLHAANKSVWMNDSEEAANRLIQSARQFNGRPMINTNYVGGLDQHKSNKTVFNDVLDTFYRRQATGAIPEDQINTINEAIRNLSKTQGTIKKRPFNDVFDIRDPDAVKAIAGTTFEGRKAISDILGKGEGTGRQFKQTPAVPDYWNIIDSHADPLTKGAPTSAVGTRLFSVDDVPAYFAKEELHPDYRWAVTGSDKQVQFPAVPQKVAVPDWYNKYYEKFKRDPHGNAWFSYPDQPQLISKDYITMAEDAGFAEGGQVQHFDGGGKVGGLTRLAQSAYDILKLTPEKIEAWRKANAKPFKQQQDPQLAQALEAYMTGKISQADYLRIMNERRPIRPLTEVPAAHSDTDIASALNRNQVEDKGILGVNLFAPQGMRVGNRLDIPAYERFGTYVDTMHDPSSGGKPIAYGHTGHLKNVEFQSDPNRAIRAGLGTREQGMTPLALEEGQGKAPFAMMVGDNQVTSNDEVRRMLAEALKDPTWRQIGMNPYRGSQFYDKADMQPVWSAAEKIQAGPLVLARDVEKTSWKDPRLKTKYGVNYAKGGLTGVQHFDRGGIAKRLLSYVDPATKKIADWNWKPMTSVAQDVNITEVPDYIQKGYGGFMQQQANKALANSLSPRDLIKAYTITQSSIGRGGLSHPTATKAGLKLPNTGGEVRPEGAFSEWLGSPMGQKYLDAASKGELAPEAMEQIRQQFAPFGKQNDLVNKMQYAAETLPQMSENLNSAIMGDKDAYRKWAEQMNGVAGAKSGFIGSLLGRGDLPTFDARQINLHTAGNAPAGLSSIMQRGKGEGGREAVDRLASRQQALGLDIDPSLDPFYQHLTHHAIWDKIGNSQTTHDDLIKAMSNYAQGGLTHL